MLALAKQTWTLINKNLLIIVVRRPFSTCIRALILPATIALIVAFSQYFFNPAGSLGVGSASPVLTLSDALSRAGSRTNVVFVDNGNRGGSISSLIDGMTQIVESAGKSVQVFSDVSGMTSFCASTEKGVSDCFAGVVFNSSPEEPVAHGIWNYTVWTDGSLGHSIDVSSSSNDAQIFMLPLQRAIDSAAAAISGHSSAQEATVDQYPITAGTNEQRIIDNKQHFVAIFINIFGVIFFFTMLGIVYHMTGFLASERELGMAQLIDAMTPGNSHWRPQFARFASAYITFTVLYLPSWLITGIVLSTLVFTYSSAAITILYHILSGLALCSYTILGASFFRKAHLSGTYTTVIALVLAIIPQVLSYQKQTNTTVLALSLLFPSSNYTYFLVYIARWEYTLARADLTQPAPAPDNLWNISGVTLLAFLIVQIFLYPLLAAFVEKTLYATASEGHRFTKQQSASEPTVILTEFTKTYKSSWLKALFKKKDDVHAVKSLTLSARKGQILMLLGPNGSGKSTTLDSIAGLSKVTSGKIDIDGTGGLGIAPQKNVLWPELNVEEHVRIFAKLKSVGDRDTERETQDLIAACDLRRKLKAKAKTLSGGQKRKLQLAMMFAGGSAVCCVDEVSSGLDPLSRRKIWDILLAERGDRTIIMTTHFLDEADFLADNIAIMSRGTLKAEGSSAELKFRLGDGYRIQIPTQSTTLLPKIPNLGVSELVNETEYTIPDSAGASHVINYLERHGINDYCVTGPTIEELFLKMAGEEQIPTQPTSTSKKAQKRSNQEAGIELQTFDRTAVARGCNLKDGRKISAWKQGWIIFQKRFTVLRRSYMPYVSAIVVAIIGAGVTPLLMTEYRRLQCPTAPQPQSLDSTDFVYVDSLGTDYELALVMGPSSKISESTVTRIAELYTANHTDYMYGSLQSNTSLAQYVQFVETLDEFNNYVSNNRSELEPGGIFFPDSGPPILAWKYDDHRGSMGAFALQNMLDIVLLDMDVSTTYASFPPAIGITKVFDFSALLFCIYFGLISACYPAFFAIYPTNERIRLGRAMQYSNGVRSAPLWLAYLSFDTIVIFIISIVTIALLAFSTHEWFALSYVFLVLILYGITATLLSYVISMFAPTSLAGWAFAAAGQVVMYFAYFGGLIGIQANVDFADLDSTVDKLHFTFALISPIASLLRTFLIALGQFGLTCRGQTYPASLALYGGPILYLVVQVLVLLLILLWWDSGISPLSFIRRGKTTQTSTEARIGSADDEFEAEMLRIQVAKSGLRVQNLSKKFGRFTAVDDVTFGVAPGETFALLGPNGAGKSTVISLIRGDIQPSTRESSILVDQFSVLTQRMSARSHLGVCPQFDAIDILTVTAYLTFFARIRGVSDPAHNVAEVIAACGLQPWAHQVAQKLSGGTKRKLSLAIALVGNPSVLLLDEPSSGLDAKSKRVMWATLAAVGRERAMVLTTHSMEEADALADRVGIMSGRMLALGDSDELRRRGGDVYHVHLVTESAPHTSAEETDAIKEWAKVSIPGAVVEQKTYCGQVRFSVGAAKGGMEEMSIGKLFNLLEWEKQRLGLAFYSVGRTTLDEVFVRIVRSHGGEEENEREAGEGGGSWFKPRRR